jgi:hypothetical protein
VLCLDGIGTEPEKLLLEDKTPEKNHVSTNTANRYHALLDVRFRQDLLLSRAQNSHAKSISKISQNMPRALLDARDSEENGKLT